jgi:hypothetical protein
MRNGFALLLLLSVAQGVAVSVAAAQVVVLRVDPAAEPLCADLETALVQFNVAADPGYFAETQRLGLDPVSEQAMAQLTPPLQVQLAIIPLGSDMDSAEIEFRDGASGASLGRAVIPLSRGTLSGPGGQQLAREVQQRLAGGAAPAGAAAPDAGGEVGADEAGDDAEAEAGGEVGLLTRLYAGAGIGTRALTWPTTGETLAVETGAFFAVEVGASFAFAFSPGFSLGPELAYQTSLDHEVEETHIAGAKDTIGIRAHHFDGVLAATFRFGESRGFRVSPAVGYGARNLRPDVHHLLTPSYSLGGPLVRLTVRIPFGDTLALRLAPELHFVSVGEALEDLGVESSGLSFGGDAAIELVLTEHLATELTFREAHAMMPSTLGSDSTDVERFATLRLAWQP